MRDKSDRCQPKGTYSSVDTSAEASGVPDGVTLLASAPPIGLSGARECNPLYPYIDPDDLLFTLADLFAGDPDLAQHVRDLGLAEHAKGKRFPFFNYLFIDASAPALGAKYGICCHRCRTAEERDVALRALLRNEVLEGGHE